MFAQMFPGMEWIPLMILLTAVGLLVGGIAVIMAVVGGAAGAARKTAAAACIIGVASPTVFLFVLWDSFSGYLCLALPLVPGLIALGLSLGSPAQCSGRRVLLVLMVIAGCIGLGVFWHWQHRRGQNEANRLVAGDETVIIDRLQIEYQQRRVICSDSAALRYIADRCRASTTDRDKLELGTTYRLGLWFANGSTFSSSTFWHDGGFSISMPDYDPVGESWPTHGVAWTEPMPDSVRTMIEFLHASFEVAQGVVLIIDADGIRRERDGSLIRH